MSSVSQNGERPDPSSKKATILLEGLKTVLYIAFGIAGLLFIALHWTQIGNSLDAVQKFSGFGLAVELRGQLSNLPIANPESGKKGFFLKQDQLEIVQTRVLWLMPALSKANILWVDDNPINNNNIIQFLQWARISVRIARNNSEAMQEIADNNFDLIISDVSRENEQDAGVSLKKCPVHFYQGFRTGPLSVNQLEKYNKDANDKPEPGFYLAETIIENIPEDKKPPILYFTAYDKTVHASCAIITTGDSFKIINSVIDVIEQHRTAELKKFKLPWSADATASSK